MGSDREEGDRDDEDSHFEVMQSLKAHIHHGRLVLDEPTDLPEGSEVSLTITDDDAMEDEERARLHAALERSMAQAKAGKLIDADVLLGRLLARESGPCAAAVPGVQRQSSCRISPRGHGQSGAVVVVQRTSSDLKLAPHLHVLLLDGVYREVDASTVGFTALPHLSTLEVGEVLETICTRVDRLVRRRGLLDDGALEPQTEADGPL